MKIHIKHTHVGTFVAVDTTPLPPVDTPVFKQNLEFTNEILGLPAKFEWDRKRMEIVFPMLARLYQLFIKTEFTNQDLQPYAIQTTPGQMPHKSCIM